jgi:Na+-translocating ferredoxin:NAD+ oxidoreductase RnfG subunit
MEIGSRKWLKQYSGYSGGELKYGKDIQTISGATISANALTRDIQILTGILKQMEF